MIIIKSKNSVKGKPAFTFDLGTLDLAQLAINIQEGDRRAIIREEDTRAFLGSLEFMTMQFRPFEGRKERFDAMEVGASLAAFIVAPGPDYSSVVDEPAEADQ